MRTVSPELRARTPEVATPRVDVPTAPVDASAKQVVLRAPERGTHAERYAEGSSSAAARVPGGALAARVSAGAAEVVRAAKDELLASLEQRGKRKETTVEIALVLSGADAAKAARGLPDRVLGAFAGAKNLEAVARATTSRLSGTEVIAFVGIAAAVVQGVTTLVRAANELLPELSEMVRRLKDLFKTVKDKDATVTIGGETTTIRDLETRSDREIAELLARNTRSA